VRVVHGKGLGSPGKTPVLKGKVQSWLIQKNEVLAFVQARGDEGGAGALVVLLKPLAGLGLGSFLLLKRLLPSLSPPFGSLPLRPLRNRRLRTKAAPRACTPRVRSAGSCFKSSSAVPFARFPHRHQDCDDRLLDCACPRGSCPSDQPFHEAARIGRGLQHVVEVVEETVLRS
jgi:hypothetical protein